MDGWIAKPSRSTRPKSWQTTLSSLAMLVAQRPRVHKAFANCGVYFFIIKCCAKHEWEYGLIPIEYHLFLCTFGPFICIKITSCTMIYYVYPGCFGSPGLSTY
jgi:hypothetical protein